MQSLALLHWSFTLAGRHRQYFLAEISANFLRIKDQAIWHAIRLPEALA